ncbi:unnamed protein product [Trichogramma brassicae]|uniref:Uncharacterized protein n=1 Tax=Trichogramma brassicae TaxID=86971 RepID=A0A6H5IPR2_9HYME|nr:unnamed protein product [Trichogramma brassicae]
MYESYYGTPSLSFSLYECTRVNPDDSSIVIDFLRLGKDSGDCTIRARDTFILTHSITHLECTHYSYQHILTHIYIHIKGIINNHTLWTSPAWKKIDLVGKTHAGPRVHAGDDDRDDSSLCYYRLARTSARPSASSCSSLSSSQAHVLSVSSTLLLKHRSRSVRREPPMQAARCWACCCKNGGGGARYGAELLAAVAPETVITRECLSALRGFRTDIPADKYEGCRPAAKDIRLGHYVNNSIHQLDIHRDYYDEVTWCFCSFDHRDQSAAKLRRTAGKSTLVSSNRGVDGDGSLLSSSLSSPCNDRTVSLLISPGGHSKEVGALSSRAQLPATFLAYATAAVAAARESYMSSIRNGVWSFPIGACDAAVRRYIYHTHARVLRPLDPWMVSYLSVKTVT